MLNPILLVPAYGRTYASAEALRNAWLAGADFRDWRGRGQYCSVRDLAALSYLTSSITITDPVTRVSIKVEPMRNPTPMMGRKRSEFIRSM